MDNPFSLDPVDPQKFIDKNDEIKKKICEILDTLQNKCRRIAICGDNRTGKSSLIKYFAYWAKKRKTLIIYNREILPSNQKKELWGEIAHCWKENCKGKDCKEFLNNSSEPIQHLPKNILYLYTFMGFVYLLMGIFYFLEFMRKYQNYFSMIIIVLSFFFVIIVILINLDEIKKLFKTTKTGLILLFETDREIRKDEFVDNKWDKFIEITDVIKDSYNMFKNTMENRGFRNMREFVLCVECTKKGSKFNESLDGRIYFDPISAERKLNIKEIVKSCIKNKEDTIEFKGYEGLEKKFGSSTTTMIGDCITICHHAYNHATKRCLFSMHEEIEELEKNLNRDNIPGKLKKAFDKNHISLSDNAPVAKVEEGKWVITDKEEFIVKKEGKKLNIYLKTIIITKNDVETFATIPTSERTLRAVMNV